MRRLASTRMPCGVVSTPRAAQVQPLGIGGTPHGNKQVAAANGVAVAGLHDNLIAFLADLIRKGLLADRNAFAAQGVNHNGGSLRVVATQRLVCLDHGDLRALDADAPAPSPCQWGHHR